MKTHKEYCDNDNEHWVRDVVRDYIKETFAQDWVEENKEKLEACQTVGQVIDVIYFDAGLDQDASDFGGLIDRALGAQRKGAYDVVINVGIHLKIDTVQSSEGAVRKARDKVHKLLNSIDYSIEDIESTEVTSE